MGIRSILIIMTITGASDLSGAFAQSANVNDISSIIRGVTAEITDTIPEFNDNADIENDYVAGAESILDNIIYEGIKSEKKSVSSESVLDFMANAYIHHDFYQTGKWDDAEDFSYIIKNVTLPPQGNRPRSQCRRHRKGGFTGGCGTRWIRCRRIWSFRCRGS